MVMFKGLWEHTWLNSSVSQLGLSLGQRHVSIRKYLVLPYVDQANYTLHEEIFDFETDMKCLLLFGV